MKLHLGCGTHIIDGWENIDRAASEGVLLGDIRCLTMTSGTVETIYAGHVIEHFDRHSELETVLRRWAELLAPGGQLFVSVPDFHWAWQRCGEVGLDLATVIDPLMGGDGSGEPWSYHKCLFDESLLRAILESVGLTDVVRYDPADYDWHPDDWARLPFSLNMRGTK